MDLILFLRIYRRVKLTTILINRTNGTAAAKGNDSEMAPAAFAAMGKEKLRKSALKPL
jgi:hypothetical protein